MESGKIILCGLMFLFWGSILNSCNKTASQQPFPGDEEKHFAQLREFMVKHQLTESHDGRPVIKDQKVIKAMLKVPRHKFVPQEMRENAYADMPLPIGDNQTISQPYMVGIMTQCMELKGDEKILEIGTGSGYQAAIFAEIAKEVYTIEIVEPLYKKATQTLNDLCYKNIKIKLGDGFTGWEEYARFDRIMITCSVTKIPEPLISQLKDGGLIVLPIGETYASSMLTVVKKEKRTLTSTPIIPCRFVPMTGEIQKD
jgi:protein-L-isoaspartate(D-aspartate) O-methyltransferase